MTNKPSLRKWLLISVGLFSLGLATAGIFLPLLPTTPFLLLAAACFIRSSDRLYRWLIGHRWFGTHIKNYREHRAVSPRLKIGTLILLWGVMGYTALRVVELPIVRILLLLIALAVTIHVLSLKTLSQEEARDLAAEVETGKATPGS